MSLSLLLAALLLPALARRAAPAQDGSLSADSRGPGIAEWGEGLQAEVAAELKEVREALASSQLELGGGSEPPRYNFTQLVGLGLYTLPRGLLTLWGNNAVYVGIQNELKDHAGVSDPNMEDARERVRVMKEMLEIARGSEWYSRGSDVLKVFVAPEFFFRGPRGAYDMRSLDGCRVPSTSDADKVCNAAIVEILLELQHFIIDDRWADWLFVFGTIVASDGEEFHNFAPVMRGGRGGVGKHHVVMKSYVSPVDFLNNRTGCLGADCLLYKNTGIRGRQYTPFSKAQRQQLLDLGLAFAKDDEFRVDGIHFGVEVCLDHAQKVLHSQLEAKREERVDVHIVTAAGMDIMYKAAKDRSPIYMQDGGVSVKTSYACEECQYKNQGSEEEPEGFSLGMIRSNGDLFQGTVLEKEASLGNGTVSCPRNRNEFYSKFGFATEGTGGIVDPRFRDEIVDKVFALDSFRPKINIGPAFALPWALKRTVDRNEQSQTDGGSDVDSVEELTFGEMPFGD